MADALVINGLTKRFGGLRAVQDVSFSVADNETLALIGPNGAGKSTCFNVLNGQIVPDSGRVRVLGADTTAKKPRAIWRMGVGIR